MENTMQTVQISREDMETIVQTEEQSEDVLLELTSASFDVICRACLNQQELFNIAEVHWDEVWLKDMLHDLFRPKEKIEKNLPQKMCQNCIEDLFVVKQFLERYHSSTKILLDTLKNETSNEEEEAYYVVVEPPPTEILTDSTETKTETIQMLKTNPVNPNVKENTTQNIKDIEETIAQTEVTENTSLVEYSVEDKNIKEETEEKVNNELNMKNDDLSQQFENEDQTEDQTHGDVIKDEEESQVHYVHITEDQIHDDDGEDEDRNKTGFDDETAENLSSNVDNAETMIVSDKSANDECDDKYQNQTVEIMDHPAKIIDQPAEIIRISSSQMRKTKQTREEKLKKKREAEKLRYNRIKDDHEEKKKWKQKYENRKKKKQILLIKEQSEEEQIQSRKVWRKKFKKHYEKRKKEREEKKEMKKINGFLGDIKFEKIDLQFIKTETT